MSKKLEDKTQAYHMLTWTLPNLLPDFSNALMYVLAFLMSPINYHIIQIRLTNSRQKNKCM